MPFDRLQKLTEKLDDVLRLRDFREHRTAGGRLDRLLGIDRHTAAALVLPSVICSLLILASPSLSRLVMAFVGFLASAAVFAFWMRLSSKKRWPVAVDLVIQVAVVLLTGAGIWVVGTDQYRESGVYRHLLIPIASALSVALLVASMLVGAMFRALREQSRYGEYLKVSELFASRGPAPEVTSGTILTALLTALFRAPLALLTVPAMAALVAQPVWLNSVTVVAFSICLLGLFIAGLNERFGTMWSLLQSVLFEGGALVVSLVVIIFSVLRLAGVRYVTTVFDTAVWWSIGVLLIAAYALSWWYDYWSHRLLTDQVLAMIAPAAAGEAKILYLIDAGHVKTSVPAEGRVLQIHGASRFIVIREDDRATFFQSHTVPDLIDTLALTGAPGGKALPTPAQVSGRMFNFHTVAALLFLLMVGGGSWVAHNGVQLPEARLEQNTTAGVSLAGLMDHFSSTHNNDAVIVVAASGGGTRAAVYTASLLEGIAKLGKSNNVVLGSGVSGGSAALAYFAANRPLLVANQIGAWDQYFDTMTQPFIQDVLERATEWRMARSGRLGMLLDESFARRWKLPPDRSKLDEIQDMGLILNTSLAGAFERPSEAARDVPLVDIEPRYRKSFTKSTLAGGRLLLTNLEFPSALTGIPLEPGGKYQLPVVLRGPDFTLMQAAALSANFPPVFPNAAIDVNNQTRYWVTDGGAVDNRGMEMLLYALRLVLDKRDENALPNLYIVVSDASGLSDAYTQDRGVSALTGAGSHFASHLDAELVAGMRQKYAHHPERFHFSYVMMPDCLRESGTFGTHWMLQSSIKIRHGSESRTISGGEMVKVLRALHAPHVDRELTSDGCKVLMWSREDRGHQVGWKEFVSALSGSDSQEPTCSTN